MDLRLSIELFNRLDMAAGKYGESKSDIVRKALKKWERLGIGVPVVLFGNGKSTTYNLLNIRVKDFESDKKPEEIRQIINWYLNDQEAKERPVVPLELERVRGGYEVVEA